MRAGREAPELGPSVRQKAPPAAEHPRLTSCVVTWPPPEGPAGGRADVTVWAFSVVLTESPVSSDPRPTPCPDMPCGGALFPRPRTGLGSTRDPRKCMSLDPPTVAWMGDTARGRLDEP